MLFKKKKLIDSGLDKLYFPVYINHQLFYREKDEESLETTILYNEYNINDLNNYFKELVKNLYGCKSFVDQKITLRKKYYQLFGILSFFEEYLKVWSNNKIDKVQLYKYFVNNYEDTGIDRSVDISYTKFVYMSVKLTCLEKYLEKFKDVNGDDWRIPLKRAWKTYWNTIFIGMEDHLAPLRESMNDFQDWLYRGEDKKFIDSE